VGDVAVISEDKPVDAVTDGLPYMIRHAVLTVIAEQGMHVMVPVQPEVLPLLDAPGSFSEGRSGSDCCNCGAES
jgi:hypothetical protein